VRHHPPPGSHGDPGDFDLDGDAGDAGDGR